VSPTDRTLRFLHPRGRVSERHPEFSWTAIHNAVLYKIWVGPNGGSRNPLVDDTINTTKFGAGTSLAPVAGQAHV